MPVPLPSELQIHAGDALGCPIHLPRLAPVPPGTPEEVPGEESLVGASRAGGGLERVVLCWGRVWAGSYAS